MNIALTEMTARDYDEVAALWASTEGVGLDDDTDGRECIEAYLIRNAGLSFVARDAGRVIGAVLCGHDGRRGYLHHLAVAPSHRRRGIAKSLVERCLSGLRKQGINKCNIMVFDDNSTGIRFWQADGWARRNDLILMQKPTGVYRNEGMADG